MSPLDTEDIEQVIFPDWTDSFVHDNNNNNNTMTCHKPWLTHVGCFVSDAVGFFSISCMKMRRKHEKLIQDLQLRHRLTTAGNNPWEPSETWTGSPPSQLSEFVNKSTFTEKHESWESRTVQIWTQRGRRQQRQAAATGFNYRLQQLLQPRQATHSDNESGATYLSYIVLFTCLLKWILSSTKSRRFNQRSVSGSTAAHVTDGASQLPEVKKRHFGQF